MKKTVKLLFTAGASSLLVLAFWLANYNAPSQSTVDSNTGSPATSSAEVRIVAFGDSLTAGYGLDLADAYPAKLNDFLDARGYAVTVINSGVSGETSAGGLRRVNFIKNLEPDIVLLGLGGNDALRQLPTAQLEKNIEEAIASLLATESPPIIILLGMQAPANVGTAYQRQFNAIYPRLAEKYRLSLVPFFLEGVALKPEYTQDDGLHPNTAGVEYIIERNIAPVLEPIVKTLQKLNP